MEDVKLKQDQVLQHYNVTMDVLEEYIRNKPTVETIKSQQNKLEKAERQIQYLKKNFAMSSIRTLNLSIHDLFQNMR